MVNTRFRAMYLAALIVVCIGLVGIVLVPKAHASAWKRQTVVASLESTTQPAGFSTSKTLFGFGALGVLSSAGLALLYPKAKH